MKRVLVLSGASLVIAATLFNPGVGVRAQGSAGTQASEDALIAKAHAIHERVIALDTHADISPSDFTPEQNYTQDLRNQVTLPKMLKGGLDAVFFIVYVGQNRTPEAFGDAAYEAAYQQAVAKFDAIHRLTEQIAPDKIGLALTSADARRLNQEGKKIAFIGVENGYSLGGESTAIARVREFQKRGARYLSLSHNGHSQLADSNTGETDNIWLHNGLSPLGKQVIAELNRVGIMVDLSHPAKTSNLQAIELSKAPVIASHSGARAVWNHSRNMDDEQLLAVKKNGGVVQAVALANYVKVYPATAERTAALDTLAAEFGVPVTALSGRGFGAGGRGRGGAGAGRGAGAPPAEGAAAPPAAAAGGPPAGGAGTPPGATPQGRGNNPLASLSEERRAELQARVQELNAKFPPPPRANVKDFVDHIDYIGKKIGFDHVGISSDFDGGGGIDGWADSSETFNITLEMVRRGYSEEQIGKIWSGNLLRVLDEVQKRAEKNP